MMAPQAQLKSLLVPRSVIRASWEMMRQDGLKGVESTVLWGGRRFERDGVVTTVVYPCGAGVRLQRNLIQIDSATTAEMGRSLRDQGLVALAQVHSHPGSWVGHSETDSDFSIASSEGFLSLVWPNFARDPIQRASELGVHRLQSGEWDELDGAAADGLITIVESELIVWKWEPDAK